MSKLMSNGFSVRVSVTTSPSVFVSVMTYWLTVPAPQTHGNDVLCVTINTLIATAKTLITAVNTLTATVSTLTATASTLTATASTLTATAGTLTGGSEIKGDGLTERVIVAAARPHGTARLRPVERTSGRVHRH